MAEKVFVSPGVYTSEKDLTFVTRQVGVTTLGLVGETTKGPAFQPIFVSNYGEFQSFFGGLNNTLVSSPIDGNGAPQYELPYIAKSYLSQSNQLFVTRVLGFSGYDAGKAWGITLDAALDPSTVTSTTINYNPIVEYTSLNGVITNISISSPLVQYLYSTGQINLSFLPSLGVGQSIAVSTNQVKNGLVFTSSTSTFIATQVGNTPNTLNPATTGSTNSSSYNPYIDFTADTNNNLISVSITDALTNTLYTNNLINLSSIIGLSVGQNGVIPTTFTNVNLTTYTGLSSLCTMVANGNTPITLSTSTVTLSGSVNSNPFIVYTATTGGVLQSVTINQTQTDAAYANSNFSLANLPALNVGQYGSIGRNYTNVSTNFTGNESTYLVVSKGFTTSAINTTTIVTTGNQSYVPLIEYTATTGNTLITATIADPLLSSLYSNGNFSLSGLPSTNTGATGSIAQSFIYNGAVYSGADASYTVTVTGVTPYYFDPTTTGTTTNVSNANLISYTASTGGTLQTIIIGEPLTNSFYNASYFSLSTIPTLSSGSRGSIPFVMTGTGTVYTGASSNYIVTSRTTIPASINTTTTGLTNGVATAINANPLITYSANVTTSAITNVVISNNVLNAMYQAGNINLTGLGGAATGTSFNIPLSFVQSGSSYVGASATFSATTSGLTAPQPVSTYAFSGNANEMSTWFVFSANTATNTATISYVNDTIPYFSAFLSGGLLAPPTSNVNSVNSINWLVGKQPYPGTYYGFLKNVFPPNSNQTLSAVTPNMYVGIQTYIIISSTGATANPDIYTGVTKGSSQTYTAATAPQYITGSTSGFTIQYTGATRAAYISGQISGITQFYSGTSINYKTGTTLGNVTYYSGSPYTVYITGSTSGNTNIYAGLGTTLITGSTSGVVNYYSGNSITVYQTGTTSGSTIYVEGYGYADVENKVVAMLRSRGRVDATTQAPVFQVSSTTGLNFDSTQIAAETNPLAPFYLTGVSSTLGSFSYECSLDKTQRNYVLKVLGRTPLDGETAVFVEEFFDKMFLDKYNDGKVRGVNLNMINYANQFSNYLQEFQPAVTPYVVSELRGNKVLRLFRIWTISDGNAANEQFKISITNIRPDTREFDVLVRGYYDNDAQPSILESFSRCTMDPTSNNYVGRRIGTLDGVYASKSSYILIETDDSSDTSDAFPAGFVGYPIRDYNINSNTSVQAPNILYKQVYGVFENKRKFYLGLSDTVGIDSDLFDYKGIPSNTNIYDMWTGLTNGFHMDIGASAATIDNVKIVINPTGGTYNPIFLFDTGDWQFRTDAGLVGGPYEKVYARKFTLVPYGGFDGWDSYRTRRTNLDSFVINGTKGQAGLTAGTFKNKTLSNGDLGINSDYYAYLEAIWTFKNPEAVNINVFATPGIDTFDNTNLVEASIEMIEQDRADSLYVVTTPDTDSAGTVLTVGDVTDSLSDMYDSSYTATYWPWIQILDAENNVYIYVPPTRDVVRNIALTDNIAFPWFAVAGIQRGDVDAIKARKKLTLSERDGLYENRINPIATFTSDGIKIWGNKTLQIKESALDRINVRRLLLQARKLISAVAIRLLFEQNDTVVRNQFLALVNPILDTIRTERGLTDFRVVLSSDPEDIDRNQLTGKIYLKPTRALEYIIVEFNIMNTGASFDNI